MDCVPILFEHAKQCQLLTKQKEERQLRIDQRRQMAGIQEEASNALKFAKQAEGWELQATAAAKQICMIVEAAKQARELAEKMRKEAHEAEKEAEFAETAKREARPTEAIEAAQEASIASEQANEAAK